MRRRDFVQALGAAASWPFVVRAQQSMPVIGFLGSQSPETVGYVLPAFWRGLGEMGFVEGKMLGSSIAGREISTIGCRQWPPNWFETRSRSS
jgi:hypothetical protein